MTQGQNTHTHTLYLATERSLQFYEFPIHPHLLGLLIALDQVQIPLFNIQSPTITKLPFPPEHSLV